MKECQLGEDTPKLGGGERDDGGMDLEYGLTAHNLYVSVFEVKRIVASGCPLLAGVFDIFTELRWGQVGYRGDT